MIRQRNFSSLRPLIFGICVVYVLVTLGTIALSFTLNTHGRIHGGSFQCEKYKGNNPTFTCGKISSSTTIQALVWIESILLLPVIALSILTLCAPGLVERLPGNTAYAIPISLCLIFVLQLVFLIITFAKGYMRHHWHMAVSQFVQSLFAVPLAYLFFNLPQINGDSEPPHLRDERYGLINNPNAKSRRNPNSDSNSGSLGKPPTAPAPTSGAYEYQPGSGTCTGTGSREQMSDELGSVTGSKEPCGSAEPVPASEPNIPSAPRTCKEPASDQSGSKPPAKSEATAVDSESQKKKKTGTQDGTVSAKQGKSSASQQTPKSKSSDRKSAADRKSGTSDKLQKTHIVVPPKSKPKSDRSGH